MNNGRFVCAGRVTKGHVKLLEDQNVGVWNAHVVCLVDGHACGNNHTNKINGSQDAFYWNKTDPRGASKKGNDQDVLDKENA